MDAWLPYLYQYGISTLLVAGVLIVALRVKALDLKRRDDLRTLLFVAVGVIFYALLHGLWLFAAWRCS